MTHEESVECIRFLRDELLAGQIIVVRDCNNRFRNKFISALTHFLAIEERKETVRETAKEKPNRIDL